MPPAKPDDFLSRLQHTLRIAVHDQGLTLRHQVANVSGSDELYGIFIDG